jgi:hypothetical protein
MAPRSFVGGFFSALFHMGYVAGLSDTICGRLPFVASIGAKMGVGALRGAGLAFRQRGPQ